MIVKAAVAVGAAALGLAAIPAAHAARFAVGLEPSADRAAVAQRLRDRGATGIVDLHPIPALAVSSPRTTALRGVRGVRYVEVLPVRRESFVPNDPFLPRQWYAAQNRAFDAWPELPPFAAVRIAVIDSGIDGSHPELQGRIAAAQSFVGGTATSTRRDTGRSSPV